MYPYLRFDVLGLHVVVTMLDAGWCEFPIFLLAKVIPPSSDSCTPRAYVAISFHNVKLSQDHPVEGQERGVGGRFSHGILAEIVP